MRWEKEIKKKIEELRRYAEYVFHNPMGVSSEDAVDILAKITALSWVIGLTDKLEPEEYFCEVKKRNCSLVGLIGDRGVPRFELCKKLKELGYPQLGGPLCWYWVKVNDRWELLPKAHQSSVTEDLKSKGIITFHQISESKGVLLGYVVKDLDSNDYIRAPSCSELGEILKPFGLPFWNRETEEWRWAFNLYLRVVTKGSEADARAMEAIWLAENGELRF